MPTPILRTADAWWVQTPYWSSPHRDQRRHHPRAAHRSGGHRHRGSSSDTVPVDTLTLLSPVTAPCRVVAQMTNYASHVKDTGKDPDKTPLTFFRKASGSISGPFDDIVKPPHVKLLDYEAEIGLVIGRELPVGTSITEANLADYLSVPGGDQRRLGPRRAAQQNPVLRGEVVSNLHPGRPGAGACRCRRAETLW